MMRGLEPEQLYAVCANSLQGLGQVKVIMTSVWNRREISGCACVSSKTFVVLVLFQ